LATKFELVGNLLGTVPEFELGDGINLDATIQARFAGSVSPNDVGHDQLI
jgi:hypothetical protein